MRQAWSAASAPPTIIFFGSQPLSAQVPPKGRKSMTATDHPADRIRIATTMAAVPVPMMARSYFLAMWSPEAKAVFWLAGTPGAAGKPADDLAESLGGELQTHNSG
jgi:hypothetical protein